MIAFLAAIFKFFDPIARITDKIVDLQIKKADAKTEQERIAADERTKALEAKRDVMIAEAGLGLNAYMRTAIALGPAVFLLKVFIWDKVLKLGSTDNLSPELWNVVVAVVGFYFLYDIAARFKR
ncbi:MAG: 3TM-type holin [Nitrospiraceae bacterium]